MGAVTKLLIGASLVTALFGVPHASGAELPTVCWNVFGDPIPQPPAPCPVGWFPTNPDPIGVPMLDRPGLIAAGVFCYVLPEGYFERCPAPPVFTG